MKLLRVFFVFAMLSGIAATAQDVLPKIKGRDSLVRTRKVFEKVHGPDEVPVRIFVDAKGAVTQVEILVEVPAELDAALRADISGWKFSPGSKNGVPVGCKITLPIVFKSAAK